MVDDPTPESRMERMMAGAQRMGAAAWVRARGTLRNPVRLLIGGLVAVLIVLAVPLLVGGGMRLRRTWDDWRHATSVTSHWVPATATVRALRLESGLDLRLDYVDRNGDHHEAETEVDTPGSSWVRSPLRIRYNPADPSQVDLVGIGQPHPLGSALIAGAALGAGTAALILAFGVWRTRRVIAVSSRPMAVVRTPLALSGAVLAVGVAAWGVGTVTTQGWASIANRIGVQVSNLFGDFMVVLVPLVAFGAGALASAWLARHRHHERHSGVLGSAHRLIDRAADYMPSPEQIRADPRHDPANPEPALPEDQCDGADGGSTHAA